VTTIFFKILLLLLSLYRWAVIFAAVYSMLVAFNVLDTRNRLVWSIGDFLYRVTEPALRPIRRFMPDLGAVDISPIILLILIFAVEMLVGRLADAILYGGVRGLLL
jgi:YggT family protein